jgi:proteasome lid subunit RPN8/RPN11
MTTEPMPKEVRDRLIEAALEAADTEICGFVLPDWTLVFMPNVAKQPNRFQMDDDALLDFYMQFPDVLGMFHSHPNGIREPSQTDIDYAPLRMRYWIVLPTEIVEWDMNDGRTPTLITA